MQLDLQVLVLHQWHHLTILDRREIVILVLILMVMKLDFMLVMLRIVQFLIMKFQVEC